MNLESLFKKFWEIANQYEDDDPYMNDIKRIITNIQIEVMKK